MSNVIILERVGGSLLTHAPVVPLGPEQAVDEDDGSIFRSGLLLRLEQVVCDFDAAVELGGGKGATRIQPERLLHAQESGPACEHFYCCVEEGARLSQSQVVDLPVSRSGEFPGPAFFSKSLNSSSSFPSAASYYSCSDNYSNDHLE